MLNERAARDYPAAREVASRRMRRPAARARHGDPGARDLAERIAALSDHVADWCRAAREGDAGAWGALAAYADRPARVAALRAGWLYWALWHGLPPGAARGPRVEALRQALDETRP